MQVFCKPENSLGGRLFFDSCIMKNFSTIAGLSSLIKAIKLASSKITEDEKWLKIVEQTMKKYKGTAKEFLIKLKYEKSLGEVRICRELNIERATYYNWRNEIVTYAALIAAQEGLIKVA